MTMIRIREYYTDTYAHAMAMIRIRVYYTDPYANAMTMIRVYFTDTYAVTMIRLTLSATIMAHSAPPRTPVSATALLSSHQAASGKSKYLRILSCELNLRLIFEF